MKHLIYCVIAAALLAAPLAQAANTATLRFQNGVVQTLNDLTVRDGKIALPDEPFAPRLVHLTCG